MSGAHGCDYDYGESDQEKDDELRPLLSEEALSDLVGLGRASPTRSSSNSSRRRWRNGLPDAEPAQDADAADGWTTWRDISSPSSPVSRSRASSPALSPSASGSLPAAAFPNTSGAALDRVSSLSELYRLNQPATLRLGPGGIPAGSGGGCCRTDEFGHPHCTKWYLCFVFMLLVHNQCLCWFTFSATPPPTKSYYDINSSFIDLLLNWGPIIFIPVVPVVAWMMSRSDGLRVSMRIGAVLVFACCVVRLVPSWLPASQRRHWSARLCLHAGQILNAAAGPVCLAGAPRLSSVWFPPHLRTTATSLAYLAGNLGQATGFLLAPYIVDDDPERVPRLLYATLGLAGLSLLLVFAYFPRHERDVPYAPAQPGAAPHAKHYEVDVSRALRDPSSVEAVPTAPGSEGRWAFFSRVGLLLRNRPLMLLVLVGGLEGGASSGWAGVFPQILAPPAFHSKFAGWCGFLSALAGVGGSLLAGLVADYFFRFRLRRLAVVTFAWAGVAYLWFMLSLPSPWSNATVLPENSGVILASSLLAGLFQGAVDPLMFEMAAELSFPAEEGTSAGLITLVYNIATLVMLGLAPHIGVGYMTPLVVLVMLFGAVVCLFFVGDVYLRSDHEAAELWAEHGADARSDAIAPSTPSAHIGINGDPM